MRITPNKIEAEGIVLTSTNDVNTSINDTLPIGLGPSKEFELKILNNYQSFNYAVISIGSLYINKLLATANVNRIIDTTSSNIIWTNNHYYLTSKVENGIVYLVFYSDMGEMSPTNFSINEIKLSNITYYKKTKDIILLDGNVYINQLGGDN